MEDAAADRVHKFKSGMNGKVVATGINIDVTISWTGGRARKIVSQ